MSTRAITLSPRAWRAWRKLSAQAGFTCQDAPRPEPALNDLWEEIGRQPSLLAQIGYWLKSPPPPPIMVAPTGHSAEAAEALVIIRSKAPVTGAIAYVRCHIAGNGWQMRIAFAEKRDDFRAIVKAALFGWSGDYGAWVRDFAPEADPAQRAAEICHRLLLAGFCVSPPSLAVGHSALSADYTPEVRRWVMAEGDEETLGVFVFRWWRSEDCYHTVMELPAARYRGDGGVRVPAEYVDEVLDFAAVHGFALTDKARCLAERAQAWLSVAMLVDELPDIPTQLPAMPDFSNLDAAIDPALLDDEEG